MNNNKVVITGVNTNNLVSLNSQQNLELFKRLKSGDTSAKQKLIEGNLKLVLKILPKCNRKNHSVDDLFQVGVIGLIKAIDNFDLSYNSQLSTYAIPLIDGEIRRYLRDDTPLRVSRSTKDLAYQILQFKEKYFNTHGIEPDTLQISQALDITPYQINYALDSLKEPVSIFEPIYNDGGDTLYLLDQIADKKDHNIDKEMYIALYDALAKLKKREQDILNERFIMGKTQTEIAQTLNISQAQVSRIEKNAIENVRRLIK